MGVRIKIRMICGDKHIETLALVNSGFESDQPDLAVSIDVAKKVSGLLRSLNLRPSPQLVERLLCIV
jgi:hypothetical protein